MYANRANVWGHEDKFGQLRFTYKLRHDLVTTRWNYILDPDKESIFRISYSETLANWADFPRSRFQIAVHGNGWDRVDLCRY